MTDGHLWVTIFLEQQEKGIDEGRKTSNLNKKMKG